MLYECFEYALPVLLEGCESVARDGYPSVLIFDPEVSDLNLVKLNLIVILFRLHSLEAHQLLPLRII